MPSTTNAILNPLPLAAATHSTVSGAASAAIVLAVIALLVVTRMRGRRLDEQRMLLIPGILIVAGIANVASAHSGTLHSIDYVIIAIDLADSLILGVCRGFSVKIYEQDGAPWYRYSPLTAGLWLLSIGIRLGLAAIGSKHHAAAITAGGDLLLMLGLTLVCQNLVVAARARRVAPAPATS
jgi:hypothetical protein